MLMIARQPSLLRCRRAAIEKVRNGSEKLGWIKRLGQHDAVWKAFEGPICGSGPAHVDDWEIQLDLSGVLSHFPAVQLAPQIDVGH